MFENFNTANTPNPYMGMGYNTPQYGARPAPMVQPPVMQGNMQGIPNALQGQSPIKALSVTSMEEAKAAILTDASLYLFVNLAQGEIYTKQYNYLTNTADFMTYKLSKLTQGPSYVTYADLQKYDDTLKKMEEELKALRGGVVNEQPNAVNPNFNSVEKQS